MERLYRLAAFVFGASAAAFALTVVYHFLARRPAGRVDVTWGTS